MDDGNAARTIAITTSGHTVVQIVDELKSFGSNVMLYPMIFVDQITPDPKPWRGRITKDC